jgi:tRNA threonylcarbamoyladenosine biosynthesis protein TsaE
MNSQESVTCMLELISQSALDTQRIGKALGELLHGGELILLDGQLGAGKTTFTQGLAKGMNISTVVNSPTFTLLKEYRREQSVGVGGEERGRGGLGPTHGTGLGPTHGTGPASDTLALYHFDLYRLDEPEEMIDLGFEEYFYGMGVCVVEWADKASDFWPPERLYIRLTALDEVERGLERNVLKCDLQRNLLFVATGSRYCELLRQFQKKIYATIGS